ncbi:MAG TPA: DNA polymerase IV [Solirubrobacteraceae bacterium]|nr:DNA polymerase IV [Solirubrobacteraceae bacterium]
MPAPRVILHADADAFFASVAQRDDPSLRGRPVIVGTGVVMAASYEARRFGVRSGMGGAKARRLCPQAVVVESRWPAYAEASETLFDVFAQTAPRVEALSVEEAFLDVTGLAATTREARAIADRLRARIREEAGLPITVGAGRTKIIAKMASRAAKPDGLLVVAPRDERAFLHPLRVEQLWGIGPATTKKLHAHDLRTVGQVAQLDEATLIAILGTASGRHVHALAHNIDRRPVQAGRPPRSFGAQRALRRAAQPPPSDELDATLQRLAERVTRRMLAAGHAGRTVHLRLRFDDFSRASRARTLPALATSPEPVLAAARALLAAAMPAIERRGLTCIGVTVANLADVSGGVQLELPDGPGERSD